MYTSPYRPYRITAPNGEPLSPENASRFVELAYKINDARTVFRDEYGLLTDPSAGYFDSLPLDSEKTEEDLCIEYFFSHPPHPLSDHGLDKLITAGQVAIEARKEMEQTAGIAAAFRIDKPADYIKAELPTEKSHTQRSVEASEPQVVGNDGRLYPYGSAPISALYPEPGDHPYTGRFYRG